MRRRRRLLDRTLDAWSDFAVDSWFYALRFAVAIFAMLVAATLFHRADGAAWARLASMWKETALFVFGVGVLLALAYRVDGAFRRQRAARAPPPNGGRRPPSKRRARRQRRTGKRKNKA